MRAKAACAALMDHVRDVGNLAADNAAERRTDTAEKSHRLNAVADDHGARGQALEAHAVDFIAGQPGQLAVNSHDESSPWPSAS